jgi:hypothetical protein
MTKPSPIESVLHGLLAGAQHAAVTSAQQFGDQAAITAAREAARETKVDAFERALTRPLRQVVEGVLHQELPRNHRAQFLFQHSQFVAGHVRAIVEKADGQACCADRTRTIVRALARHLAHGTPIAFDYTQEYTFHLPGTVLREHADIVTLFDALLELYHGNAAPYLTWLATLPPTRA